MEIVGFVARSIVHALDAKEVERPGSVPELVAAIERGRFVEYVDHMLGLEIAPMVSSEPPHEESVATINREVARRYAKKGLRCADAKNEAVLVALGFLVHLVWRPDDKV